MNTSIKLSFALFAIILFLFISISAQSFEGKIISKDISISIIALDELMYENEEYDEDASSEENYDEDEYSLDVPQIPKKIMDKYFALSLQEMKEAVNKFKSEFDAEYMDNPLYKESTSEIIIKGSKMRADTEEEGMKMSMLIDTKSSVAKIIRWGQKVVINMDLEKMKAQMEAALGAYSNDNDQKEFSLKSTGETKEINGFMCELYKGTNSNNNYEHVWFSKSVDGGFVKSFSKMSELFAKLNPEEGDDNDLEFFIKNKVIPILTKSITGGEMIQIEEILKIEEKAINDSEFEIPEGFTEMDMSQMIQQGFE